MADILLFENGDGGELKLRKSDLFTTIGYENMPYLALFGGDENWWGNTLFGDLDESALLFSKTSQTLESVALNSAGRVKIESAITEDLSFIKKNIPGTTIDVNVIVVSDDRLDIKIFINGILLMFMWNPILKSLDTNRAIFTGIFTEQFTEQFN